MQIQVENDGNIACLVSCISDDDLPIYFADIVAFRKTGELRENSPLRDLEREARTRIGNEISMLRIARMPFCMKWPDATTTTWKKSEKMV